MKIIKKCLLGVSAIGLTLSLSACGNKDSNEGDIGMSNVLNSKKMLPIVVTEGENDAEKDHILWAGFIGNGKVKAMNLDGTTYFYGYKDLKKLSNKEFNKSIIEMGKDSEPTPREYVTSKTNVKLKPNSDTDTNSDKAESVSLDFLNNDDDIKVRTTKTIVSNPNYSKVVKKEKNDEWSTIKATDTDEESDYKGYEMHIKIDKNEKSNLKLDDIKEAEKNYDNVTVE